MENEGNCSMNRQKTGQQLNSRPNILNEIFRPREGLGSCQLLNDNPTRYTLSVINW